MTTYIESATGVEEGGRSGLTAVATAGFFLLALFLTPIFVAVPAIATAPALIVVGALMMRGARALDWTEIDEAVPAFLTIVLMPLTYSITVGIAAGFLTHTLIKIVKGKAAQVHVLMWIVSAACLVYFLQDWIGAYL